MPLSLSWEQVSESLCPPSQQSGLIPPDVYNVPAKCRKDVDQIKRVADALIGLGETWYLFVSDGEQHKLWGFSGDVAFAATAKDFHIAIYKPSRDFRAVYIIEMKQTCQQSETMLKVAVEGPEGTIDFVASANNTDALYGCLPYLLGLRGPKPPSPVASQA